jgi:hypothetical protein
MWVISHRLAIYFSAKDGFLFSELEYALLDLLGAF